MQIVTRKEVRPSIKRARTKSSLLSIIRSGIRSGTFTISSQFGSGISNANIVRVYNLEKHRPLKKQSPRANYDGDKGKIRKTKIQEPGHWTARVYDFQRQDLENAGLKVLQGNRTFKIEDSKGNRLSLAEYKALNR